MALSSNQLAILTARFGAMRFGASRFGFSPRDTRNQSGTAPGPYYTWKKDYPATTTWTKDKT